MNGAIAQHQFGGFFLFGGAGKDTLDGGHGLYDLASYTDRTLSVSVTLAAGTNATVTIGGAESLDCTSTRKATSPRGGPTTSATGRRFVQQHRLPLLLAGQHRQRLAVDLAQVVIAAGQLDVLAQ